MLAQTLQTVFVRDMAETHSQVSNSAIPRLQFDFFILLLFGLFESL